MNQAVPFRIIMATKNWCPVQNLFSCLTTSSNSSTSFLQSTEISTPGAPLIRLRINASKKTDWNHIVSESRMSSLVCYTVDSDSEPEDMEEEIKIEPGLTSAEASVMALVDELLNNVVTGTRDFSDMFIKEEPQDDDDDWFSAGDWVNCNDYRTNIKIELESDESDSDDSSVEEPIVKLEEYEGKIYFIELNTSVV